jgi:chemotaxis regulatin CheY-phosphate phosphatase CheZ
MASNQSLTPLSENDYETIEAAVMETGRGRWFLAEFAKRNRHSDTYMLLDAIARLEQTIVSEHGSVQVERIRADLVEMSTTIAQLKSELASDNPDQNSFEQATEALDAVVQTTENATSSILEAAEHIQEIAWTLRESGTDVNICDTLDQRSADIYTACSFQDLTAQRTKKVVRTMRNIEGRINGLVDAWSAGEKANSRASSGRMVDHAMPPVSPRSERSRSEAEGNLSHEDIELMMRENDDPLIVIEHHETISAPQGIVAETNIGPDGNVTLPGDEISNAAHQLPSAGTVAKPSPSLAQSAALVEIDALTTSRKIEMFS